MTLSWIPWTEASRGLSDLVPHVRSGIVDLNKEFQRQYPLLKSLHELAGKVGHQLDANPLVRYVLWAVL